MRKWLNVFFALVMTVMCGTALVLPAYASELPGVSVPVTMHLTGTIPNPPEDYSIVMAADNAGCPLPEGAADDAYVLTITGEETESFPTITYDRVGIYTYKIYQVAGTNKRCTYDQRIYYLTVTITNKPDYSGLEATVALHVNGKEFKITNVEFTNKYPWVVPDTPQTGDESSPMLYAILIAVSMGVIVTLFLTRKSKKREE